jgi:acetoin utilization protein AcuC
MPITAMASYYGFESDPDLIFADIHEDGQYLYPGTGREDEVGRGAAAGDQAQHPGSARRGRCGVRGRVARVLAHLRKYEPEFHPAAGRRRQRARAIPSRICAYAAETHIRAARDLARLAEDFGHGRVLGTGGGGYKTASISPGPGQGVVHGLDRSGTSIKAGVVPSDCQRLLRIGDGFIAQFRPVP